MMSTAECELSVILPCANERDNLEPLLEELARALRGLNRSFEVIVVDDGSTDGSQNVLRAQQMSRGWLRIFQHRVNCGQSACYCTGFRFARGEIVITMDADRQHDPADIAGLLAQLGPETAAVCGVRAARHDNWLRRCSSQIANGFASAMIGRPLVDAGCTFRVIRKSALAEVPVFNGQHRFLPTLLQFQGYPVVRAPISHRTRQAGKSKYGIGNRLWRGVMDCLAMRWYHKRCLRADRLSTAITATASPAVSAQTRPVPPEIECVAAPLRGELKP